MTNSRRCRTNSNNSLLSELPKKEAPSAVELSVKNENFRIR